ncbi:MAG: ATP-dependent Clp protease ATP-binding subunit, partial [Muribaculaceae bacterium]|nr:ATP-dependent Clp protease ATP-binding subunit [Muribaculaceae bacterium]
DVLKRIVDIWIFDQLDKDAIFKIIDVELADFYGRVTKLGYELKLSEEAKDFIATKGYDKNFGARPLKRAIQKYLEDDLAELLLKLNAEGKLGGVIEVSRKDPESERLDFNYIDPCK